MSWTYTFKETWLATTGMQTVTRVPQFRNCALRTHLTWLATTGMQIATKVPQIRNCALRTHLLHYGAVHCICQGPLLRSPLTTRGRWQGRQVADGATDLYAARAWQNKIYYSCTVDRYMARWANILCQNFILWRMSPRWNTPLQCAPSVTHAWQKEVLAKFFLMGISAFTKHGPYLEYASC